MPVQGGQAAFGPVAVPDGVLCIRPEAIGESGALHVGRCRVEEATFFGTHLRAHVAPLAAPDVRLVVHLPQGAVPEVGAVLDLWARDHVVLEA